MRPTIEWRVVARLSVLLDVASLGLAATAAAQNPLRNPADAVEVRYADSQPVIAYTLRVDPADTTGFAVEMRLRNVPDTFRVAMVRHPEYDDRFWRFMSAPSVSLPNGSGSITRVDSAVWRVVGHGGEAALRWRVGVPAWSSPIRPSWRPVVRRDGALVGGPHAFLYVVGAELAPAAVTIEIPAGWEIATGLVPTSDPHRFFAPSAGVLTDSPIMVGRFASWRFTAGETPHRLAYWALPDGAPFDSGAFVAATAGVAREAIALFGHAPYREYTFLVQDGAYGGLEHANSVTIGVESRSLADGMGEAVQDLAHEYFHAWNLVRIRPAGRDSSISWKLNGATRGLWFSEGLTMLYADLLPRRAGAPLVDSTRVAHVERLLGRYLSSAGSTTISPERASLAEYAGQPGTLGDLDPSVHDQGEVIGTMLDLVIRDATGDRQTIDDLMRLMMRRFSGDSGFTTASIERAAAGICNCALRPFFDRWVRGGGATEVDRYLRLIGYRARIERQPARSDDGAPRPDLRAFSWLPPGRSLPSLLLIDPRGIWARAGLHTNDEIVSVNGTAIPTPRAFRAALTTLHVGDTARVAALRGGRRVIATVPIAGYDEVDVRLEPLPGATAEQLARRARWAVGR